MATLSRRQLLAAFGGAALTTGGLGPTSLPTVFGQQIDASPPAVTPGAGPTASFNAPSVADKAAELDYDVARIFRFVADEIRYEPYSGALRGPTGTLWARAGNSVDKALLLGALFDAALVTYRFAWGALDGPSADALLAASQMDANEVRTQWAATIEALLAATGAIGEPATPAAPALTPAQNQALKAQFASVDALGKNAGSLLDTRVNAITGALATAGISLPPAPAAQLPPAEHDRHVWVQRADGPAWIDDDAALPGAVQGKAMTGPASAGALPDDLHHRVRFSVVAEEIHGGQPQRRETTFFEVASADLVNVPVCLYIAPPADLKGIGNTISQAFTGKASVVPTFFSGKGGSYADTAVTFGVAGSGIGAAFGATPVSGVAEGEALALWLNVDISGPDHDPIHVERTLFDRVAAGGRVSGKVDLQAVGPVEYVKSADGSSTVRGLQSMWIYSVDGAHFPAVLAGTDPITARIFGGLQLLPQGYPTLRASLAFQHELPRGYRSYVHVPNVIGFAISQDTNPPSIRSDLLSQRPAVAALRAAQPATVAPLLVAGVANQIAEQMLFAQPGAGAAAPTPAATSPTAQVATDSGSLLAAIESRGIGWQALSGAAPLGAFPPAVAARLKAALDTGQVVVVPTHAVQVEGNDRYVWWVVDPQTGRTYDQLDDGSGSAGRHLSPVIAHAGPMDEEITIVEKIPAGAAEGYRRLAVCVAAVCGGVSMSLAMIAAGIGYATATSALGKIGAVVGGASAAAGGVGAGIGIYFACGG